MKADEIKMIISIGDIVSVKGTGYVSKVKNIKDDKYQLYGMRGLYDFGDLEKMVCLPIKTSGK